MAALTERYIRAYHEDCEALGVLRAALTGITHGPELAPLVSLMGGERVERRLAAAGHPVAT